MKHPKSLPANDLGSLWKSGWKYDKLSTKDQSVLAGIDQELRIEINQTRIFDVANRDIESGMQLARILDYIKNDGRKKKSASTVGI